MNDVSVMPPPRPQRATMIKNLVPRLPERGHVKIGELGESRQSRGGGTYQIPRKLSHFRVTTLERGKDGNFLPDQEFHAKYGDTPTEIPVRLLFDQIELNAPSRYGCYVGKTLWCSGDGESAVRISAQPDHPALTEPLIVPCTCSRQDPTYKGKDRCKMNLMLSVLIDGISGVGGVYKFRTTSFNSITGILSSLTFIRSVTGGILANIPLKLRLQPKQATNPNDQSPVTIYVVSLEFTGNIEELQQIGHQVALTRATTHMSIANIEEEARRRLALPGPADAILPGDDPDDVRAEFFPEQIVPTEATAAPPRPRREDYADDPNVDGETGEIIETDQPAADQGEADPEAHIYWVVNLEGVEIECPTAAEADKLLTEIFTDAKRRGKSALEAAAQDNHAAFEGLEASGHADIVEGLRQIYRDAIAAEPVSATERRQTTKRNVTRATEPASQQGQEASPPPHSKTAERPGPDVFPSGSGRGDIQPSPPAVPATERPGATVVEHGDPAPGQRYIEPPLVPNSNRINFPILRDMLCNMAKAAQTRDEIVQFETDNQPNLRRLIADLPQYAEQVIRAIADAKQRIGSGGA